jgi:hypothetical protein
MQPARATRLGGRAEEPGVAWHCLDILRANGVTLAYHFSLDVIRPRVGVATSVSRRRSWLVCHSRHNSSWVCPPTVDVAPPSTWKKFSQPRVRGRRKDEGWCGALRLGALLLLTLRNRSTYEHSASSTERAREHRFGSFGRHEE